MKIVISNDLAAAHAIRRTVFIDEQGYSEAEEWDDLDDHALILLAMHGETPIATARLFVREEAGVIGRICVLKPYRGTGLGAALVTEGCLRLRAAGCRQAHLSAQTHAIPFYEKLGFTAHGDAYLDGAIPHRDMEKPL
ncbi:MAG TPA: GNAT family N-acetyltransferase [Paenirhodobacter sp.]